MRDWLKANAAATHDYGTETRHPRQPAGPVAGEPRRGAAAAGGRAAPVELVTIETHGDRDQATALAAMGGFGVFTKAIQNALLDDRADVAVHSLKDLPDDPGPRTRTRRGAAARADRRCVRLAQASPLRRPARRARSWARAACAAAPRCSTAGPTSSSSTSAATSTRGCGSSTSRTSTRSSSRKRGWCGSASQIESRRRLDQSWMLPAVGQGAIGLECRADDEDTKHFVEALRDTDDVRPRDGRAGDALRTRRRLPRADRGDIEGGRRRC